MFREICNDKTNVSADILLILEQFEDFLTTYSANGEIEVWRNTLPCLISHLTLYYSHVNTALLLTCKYSFTTHM